MSVLLDIWEGIKCISVFIWVCILFCYYFFTPMVFALLIGACCNLNMAESFLVLFVSYVIWIAYFIGRDERKHTKKEEKAD